ncbi:unnamed protein product [Chrysodeixis includens]|uniref:Caspase-8 n=1 Tax=Chrysodeixis includens TaxID=689277 RepID=A0A9N8KT29_CHRIL|nr:unnamed protein product [Chrysodeixis includens]
MEPDSRTQGIDAETIIGNNDIMNMDIISEIEKELHDNPYDMTSLVFLLYDTPDTALQRLTVFQRVSNDAGASINLNMLHEWFRHAKHNQNWKHEFIEALLLCQLFSIVRKLGFNVPSARRHYQTDNIHVKMYINPLKKALYKLCENINSDNLLKLKKTLLTYDIDTTEYDSCELIFLKLMCVKFITIDQFQYDKKILGYKVNLDKLLKIVESLPGLKKVVMEINLLQQSINEEHGLVKPVITSTPAAPIKVDESKQKESEENFYNMDFDDVFKMLGELHLDDSSPELLKSDNQNKLGNDSYAIKSNKRIGVCVIVNQENFYPSKDSLEITGRATLLDRRIGSDKDRSLLERTMSSLNFSVFSKSDLDHKLMLKFIKDVIKYQVTKDDSIFMLCILSHGVKGHVYAADSVKIKMDDIQSMLDSEEAVNIHDKPKLLIVQACQVDESKAPVLVPDNPSYSCNLKKTNFLIYYATAPDLEAYRSEKTGSVFIQILCRTIRKFANVEPVVDIFTKVTNNVTLLCNKVGYTQVPIFQSTLMKKLYLQIPK